ncbi:fungal specific transcription factor domain-containing protein [Colletotrichum tofieldiae]|uniref:Fungal specific transcription factor domain-containing protein n=1 Tax=Colletotrichum tofieldiae TaxID=708197 RepID=A0A166PVW4_9PEZI|nr:fungal specific transcription factor domain-containing protein [Colletotrichum tofieldiae]GKT64649.1 fungal specific transcription factor domain-containing protein [Colletotrichum tofieldiae]GKT74622.1 fungal specific transcription factor domain-containing protein [Colletotrichum tofieldiae]GKT91811.1 fungal specific transcription factor domain-containing protein [Colletotrichum tofieldiae]
MTPPSSSATAARQQPDPSSGGTGSSKQQLSCANCRHRKIKCDKLQPRCKQCERSDLDCVFPSRKRNRKPRQGRQSELLSRITRLESIVSKVDSGNLDGADRTTSAAAAASTPLSGAASAAGGKSGGSVVEMSDAALSPSAGWDPQPAPPTNYMSAEFWENLCQEVEGMRQALDQPSESEASEDEGPATTASPESVAARGHSQGQDQTPPALSGLLSSIGCHSTEALKHPSREHILYMCRIFFSNIDPAFKVIHRPTISAELEDLANSPNKRIDAATEALFFSVYFGAITGLSHEACLANLGEERRVLAQRYREGVEKALQQADFLNSTEIRTLQALTNYVCFLRSHNASRASWALIPLVVRLAQALHLHRDGVSPPLPPFEAEMRRRLWWMIVVLDIRAAEDRGTDAAIPRQSYNTRLPFNLDDDDFGPSTTTPLEDRTGPTEMTFCLCTSMSSGIFGNLRPKHPQLALDSDSSPEMTTSEDEIMAHAQRLESLFGTAPPKTPASPSQQQEQEDVRNLPASHAAVTVRIIILKMWLSAQYPFTPRAATAAAKPRVARETMLRTAVNTIELVELSTATYRERFGWWIDSYVQWHPLAVALAELCVQTRGELVDRAWGVVDRNYNGMRDRIADTRRGTLWRPLRKLLRKARAARAEAMMGDLKLGDKKPAPAVGRETVEERKEEDDDKEENEDFDVDVEGDGDGDEDVDAGADVQQGPSASALHPAFKLDRIGIRTGNEGGSGGRGVVAPDRSATIPPTAPLPTTSTMGLDTPMAIDAQPPTTTDAQNMPNVPYGLAPEDMEMFTGSTPLWGHPQYLINHFGIQMDAGDFTWDPSTWNEFVTDASLERSPGDD